MAAGINDIVVSVEDFSREIVLAQVLPDIFLRVELGAVGGEFHKRDVFRDDQAIRDVPACAVDQQDGVRICGNMAADFREVQVHGGSISVRQDKRAPCVSGGTDCTEDVSASIALIALHAGPCAFSGPDMGQRAFLSDPCLILEPEFDALAFRSCGQDFCDFPGEVFLKSSIRARSASGCSGRVDT